MRAIAQNHNTEDNGARRDVNTASSQEQVTRTRSDRRVRFLDRLQVGGD